IHACHFDAIIETGTFRGSTTLFLAHNSGGAPVFTSEVNTRVFETARRRLRAFQNLHMYNLDSRQVLKTADLARYRRPFFYLDAHWLADLPLSEEINVICQKWVDYVVMVDDFQVPDDPGYGYDDYG